MSDVSATFDRVLVDRLLLKLRTRKVPEEILKVIASWMRARWAEVVVGGVTSLKYCLQNMVFQGIVWGPMLWNVFYADAKRAIRECSFTEIVFADDLNAFRKYGFETENTKILNDISACQIHLHKWGMANCVVFDKGKEFYKILSRKSPHGDSFSMLGISFDCSLVMSDSVFELARNSKLKLSAILRTKRYNSGLHLVSLYKSQLLSYIEYRTPAIYHACDSSLAELDIVQSRLIEAAGMSDIDALQFANLAPLAARRDMALLGLIHRTILGTGPAHFCEFFVRDEQANVDGRGKHRLQLRELGLHELDFRLPGSRPADCIARSMFGLIAVYHKLPAKVVEACASVSSFQGALQGVLLDRALSGQGDWKKLLSPRQHSNQHPLDSLV